MFGFILGMIVGCAQPMLTSINSELRRRLRSPFLSSMGCFAVALSLSLITLLVLQHSLYIPIGNALKEPLWIWLGGVCGFTIVIFSILCLPHLGSVETIVFLVLGQIISGLVIDHFGLFGSTVIPVTLRKIVGAILVFAGVLGTVWTGDKRSDSGKTESSEESIAGVPEKSGRGGKSFYRMLDLIAGIACSVQIAVNGRLGVVLGSTFRATVISMLVAVSGISLITLILYVVRGRSGVIDDSLPKIRGKWWMWTGGFCSMTIVGGNVILQSMMGTGLAAILNILGQTAGGVVIDATGFLGIPVRKLTIPKFLGLLVMVLGTAMI
ncbi:MAG: DMT family transporter [Eubacteriales bacterium]|nr:DMT family transporter [Eubacteriales bacterium]